MPYKVFKPGVKTSSPASARATMKVWNNSAGNGKFSIKIGANGTEQEVISHGIKKKLQVAHKAVVLVNKGKVDLEWLRS